MYDFVALKSIYHFSESKLFLLCWTSFQSHEIRYIYTIVCFIPLDTSHTNSEKNTHWLLWNEYYSVQNKILMPFGNEKNACGEKEREKNGEKLFKFTLNDKIMPLVLEYYRVLVKNQIEMFDIFCVFK